MRGPKNVLLRGAAVLAAGLGFAVAGAGLAGAAGPQPVAPNELSKATTAARSATALSLLGKAGGTAKAAATIAQDTHPIYALNAAFVRDASAPVATFWYAATSASAGGKSLTVYTTPDGHGGWQAVNVASGNTESRMVAAAGGATLFTEPQLGAWYALTATQVRPLNPSAVKSIGSKPIGIAAYQDLVSHRYSDKLPGSHYNDLGTAGGYDTAQSSTAAVAVAQAAPTHDLVLPIAAAGGGAAVGLVLLVRRRSRLPEHGSGSTMSGSSR
ncbi:hypothetical protein JOF29_003274 [Kribbella aluminosa]|uniref:Uncharacterized protein n=1 Tax=Kribbella aluminosa TaxID=416017 RepID=A0ABS4UKL4_9ACTN|nr:hypothetical protein [Kribbella aluminosa]MBP2352191.1 hypothetical protein [Kribbella aluminosa]